MGPSSFVVLGFFHFIFSVFDPLSAMKIEEKTGGSTGQMSFASFSFPCKMEEKKRCFNEAAADGDVDTWPAALRTAPGHRPTDLDREPFESTRAPSCHGHANLRVQTDR